VQLILLTALRVQSHVREALSTSCGKPIVVFTVTIMMAIWYYHCHYRFHHVYLFSISQCYCLLANCSHLHWCKHHQHVFFCI
jgi:hypothetical protein